MSAVLHYIDRSQLVEGTDCVVEMYCKQQRKSNQRSERVISDQPNPGHHDIITDMVLYHTSEPFIVSTSADGVVKVWK